MATRTIVVAGNGTNQLSYQLDGPDETGVFAVLAEIDANAAGDTIATLLATSPAGSDVAAVPQGQAVSGGGQGRATWALRLAEDASASGGGSITVEDAFTTVANADTLFAVSPLVVGHPFGHFATLAYAPAYAFANIVGTPVAVTTEQALPFTTTDSLGVTAGPTSWTIEQDGYYRVYALVSYVKNGPAPATFNWALNAKAPAPTGLFDPFEILGFALGAGGQRLSTLSGERTRFLSVGDTVTFSASGNAAGLTYDVAGGLFEIIRVF